jgi:hypothetical protein
MELTNREPGEPEFGRDLSEATGEFGARFPHCPKPAVLQAAQAGVLPVEVGDEVRKHVSACAACSVLVRDLAELDESPLQPTGREKIWGMIRSGISAEEAAAKPATSPAWWKLIFRPAPVAIFAAAAVLLVVGGRLLHEPQPPAPVVTRTHPPEPVAPPPAGVLRVEKAPVILPASAVLVWRGDANAGNTQGKDLREALLPYEADQYAEAAQRLEGLAKKYPRLAEAHFYLGVSRLFLDRNADAAASLKTARSLAGPALRDHTAWYLAIAWHKGGHDADARPLLEQLCRSNGTNSDKACTALKELPVVQ